MPFRATILAAAGALFVAAMIAGEWKSFAAAAESGPIVIDHGGTYQGDWSSDDPKIPVIKIATHDPVIIEKSRLRGRGTLINADCGDANVTVRDTSGFGLNPNVPDRAAGRFLHADQIAYLDIEHCTLDGTAGIYIHELSTRKTGPKPSIRIIANAVKNIDGRRSDGHGGYRDFNRRTRVADGHVEEGFDIVQFVQFDGVVGLEGGEIAWNKVVNEPGRSRVEDNISIYESGGTEKSPLLIHDNCIVGAYTIDPTRSREIVDGWREDWDFSGGGIMVGDGPEKTLATASGFVKAFHNLVVATTNYGMAVSSGHDMQLTDNRVLASGILPDGRRAAGQNVGIYIWDVGKGARRVPPTFFGNGGSGNIIGWAAHTPGTRNDWWIGSAADWSNNTHWPGEITHATEQQEIDAWDKSAASASRIPSD